MRYDVFIYYTSGETCIKAQKEFVNCSRGTKKYIFFQAFPQILDQSLIFCKKKNEKLIKTRKYVTPPLFYNTPVINNKLRGQYI